MFVDLASFAFGHYADYIDGQTAGRSDGRRWFVDGMPELYIVSNVLKDGEPIGSLGYGEAVWHTDMSYLPDPPPGFRLSSSRAFTSI